MKKTIQLLCCVCLLASGTSASAHSLWLLTQDAKTTVGQPVVLDMGWGHHFPKDGEIPEGMLDTVSAVGPNGNRTPLQALSGEQFEFAPSSQGFYVISAKVHPGFVSRTVKGYKMLPKDRVEKAVSCFRYDLRTKTVVQAGDDPQMPIQPVGDPLEILPLQNPVGLQKGDRFSVKILFQGKPLAQARVSATYAGYSGESGKAAVNIAADKEGAASFEIPEQGEWMISVTHEIPYSNPIECDTYKYNATFTFDAGPGG